MHPPLDKRVFEKEARFLAAAGHEVIHLAPGDEKQWEKDGVKLITYAPTKGIIGRLLRMRRFYADARRLNAHVYHCNEVDSWLIGLVLKFLAGKQCVFDVHEHYPEDFAEIRNLKWTKPLVTWGLSVIIKMLSRYTSQVVLAKQSLIEAFDHLPSKRVHLVQNFASIAALPDPAPDNKINGKKPLRLIHLGLFNRYRGWPQLLKALSYSQYHDTELLVLGAIDDGSAEEFFSEIDRLGLSERVIFKSWLPYEEAIELVKSADIGIVAFQPGYYNHIHALPHKLFDYMGAGLAVLAPYFAVEVASIVEKSQCGLLIDSADPESIAAAIDKLGDNRDLLAAMGRSGQNAVLKKYNWETEAQRLVAMYTVIEMEIQKEP